MKERNYKIEYEMYQSSEEQKKRRAQRNRDRNAAIKKGTASKGDGKDIHHVNKTNLKNPKNRDRSKNRADNCHHKGEKQKSWK
jgi:hypothetical protein